MWPRVAMLYTYLYTTSGHMETNINDCHSEIFIWKDGFPKYITKLTNKLP